MKTIILILAASACRMAPLEPVQLPVDMTLGYWKTWPSDEAQRRYLVVGYMPVAGVVERAAVVAWENEAGGVQVMDVALADVQRHDASLITFKGQEYIPVVNADEHDRARHRLDVRMWMRQIGGPRL